MLNIIGILCINLGVNTWGKAMFDLGTFPDWANTTGNPWICLKPVKIKCDSNAAQADNEQKITFSNWVSSSLQTREKAQKSIMWIKQYFYSFGGQRVVVAGLPS